MLTVSPEYITDKMGKKKSVVLSLKEFKNILKQLEELEDIHLYDQAKKNDDGVRIPFEAYLKSRKKRNA